MKDRFDCGVYRLLNKNNGKCYIGSTISFTRRFKEHLKELNNDVHGNDYLQKAYNKHGAEAFIFEKLVICATEDLLMYEQIFMDHFECYNRDKGYNILEVAGSPLGRIVSDETKAKLSAKLKGRVISEESKRKASITLTGRVFTEEHKRKISESNKGTKPTEKCIIKGKEFNTGRIHSEETKKLWSEQRKGVPKSKKHAINIAKALTGIPHSEERKSNISKSLKGRTPSNKGKKMTPEQYASYLEGRKRMVERKNLKK